MRDKKSVLLFFFYSSVVFANDCYRISSLQNNPCDFQNHLTLPYGICGVELEDYKDAFEIPSITFEGENDKKYILFMVDSDAPNREDPYLKFLRHWVVSDLTAGELEGGDMKFNGNLLTSYQPPDPPLNSGLHRYQFYLFEQHESFNPSLQNMETSRAAWNFDNFLRVNDFCGALVATYQFETEKRS